MNRVSKIGAVLLAALALTGCRTDEETERYVLQRIANDLSIITEGNRHAEEMRVIDKKAELERLDHQNEADLKSQKALLDFSITALEIVAAGTALFGFYWLIRTIANQINQRLFHTRRLEIEAQMKLAALQVLDKMQISEAEKRRLLANLGTMAERPAALLVKK